MKKTWIIITLLLFLTGCVTVVEQSDEINDSSLHQYYDLPLTKTSIKQGENSISLKEKLGNPSKAENADPYAIKYEYENIDTIFGMTESAVFTLSEEVEKDIDGSEYNYGIYEAQFVISGLTVNEAEQALKTYYGPNYSKTELGSSIAGIFAENEGLEYFGYKYIWDDSLAGKLPEEERQRTDALLDAFHENGIYPGGKDFVHLNDDSPLVFINVEGYEESHLIITFYAPLYCSLNIMGHK